MASTITGITTTAASRINAVGQTSNVVSISNPSPLQTQDTVEISDEARQGNVPAEAPAGFDQGKWSNPNHTTPKYVVSRAMSTVIDQVRAIPDEAGRKQFVQNFLHTQVGAIEKAGGTVLQIRNEKILLDMNDGHGPHWVDTVQDIDGKANVQWHVEDGQSQQAAAAFGMTFVGGLGNSFGNYSDARLDPAVQKTVQDIRAAGGSVLHVSRTQVLGEFNDGQGPRWVPVVRQQSNVDSMLRAMLGQAA